MQAGSLLPSFLLPFVVVVVVVSVFVASCKTGGKLGNRQLDIQ